MKNKTPTPRPIPLSTYKTICEKIIEKQTNVATRLKLKPCLKTLKEAEKILSELSHKYADTYWTFLSLTNLASRIDITIGTKAAIIACAKVTETAIK